MPMERKPYECVACNDAPSLIQIVVGVHYPNPIPVCKACALDALRNPDNWNLYVPFTLEETNA